MNIFTVMGLTPQILIKTYFMNIIKIRLKIYLIIVLTFFGTVTYGQGFIWNDEIEQQFINEVPELEVSRAVFLHHTLWKDIYLKQCNKVKHLCVWHIH